MIGFFMVRREAFEGAVRDLSSIGFKILLDLLASSHRPLQVKEIPYHFRERQSGESKFDALIGWEYLMLLADKAQSATSFQFDFLCSRWSVDSAWPSI
jgi:dolichol-phosphate mannosyltransferase